MVGACASPIGGVLFANFFRATEEDMPANDFQVSAMKRTPAETSPPKFTDLYIALKSRII